MRTNPNYRYQNTGDRNYNAELYQFCLDFQSRRHENGDLDVFDEDLESLSKQIAKLQHALKVYERKTSSYPKIEKPQQRQREEAQAQEWRDSLLELTSIKDRLEEKLGEQFLSSSDKRLEFNPLLLLMDILENTGMMFTPAIKTAEITRCFYDEKLPALLNFQYVRPVLEKIIDKIDLESLQEFFRIYAAPSISKALQDADANSAPLKMTHLAMQSFAGLLANCGSEAQNLKEARVVLNRSLALVNSTISNLAQSESRQRIDGQEFGINDALAVLDAAIRTAHAARTGDSENPQLLQMRQLSASANSSAPQTRPASPSASATNGGRAGNVASHGTGTDF